MKHDELMIETLVNGVTIPDKDPKQALANLYSAVPQYGQIKKLVFINLFSNDSSGERKFYFGNFSNS